MSSYFPDARKRTLSSDTTESSENEEYKEGEISPAYNYFGNDRFEPHPKAARMGNFINCSVITFFDHAKSIGAMVWKLQAEKWCNPLFHHMIAIQYHILCNCKIFRFSEPVIIIIALTNLIIVSASLTDFKSSSMLPRWNMCMLHTTYVCQLLLFFVISIFRSECVCHIIWHDIHPFHSGNAPIAIY